MMRATGSPVGLPGLAVLAVGYLAFEIALLAARRHREPEQGGVRSRRSIAGIAVQALAFLAVAFGPQQVTLDPLGTPALLQAAIIALLMTTAVALFTWSSRAMGRNWSVVARTRADHQLIETGPFAYVRNPIYVALACLVLALAIALGHTDRLWIVLPLYALGTWLRVSEEERLLRAQFGPAYDAYASRVKRFVPGVF